MAQTWRTATWHNNFWAESVWSGLDNAVAPDTTVGGSGFHDLGGGWRWFWMLVPLFFTR